jgi:RimJ/RimL family protein N-acetyltransferase
VGSTSTTIYSRAQPSLQGHGLFLSPFTPADVPAMLVGDRDPETARRLGWAPEDPSAEKAQAYVAQCAERWRNADRVPWAVREQEQSIALGHVELNMGNERRARVSFSTYPPARGRGLAARAVDLVCVFAFDELCIARVQLLTDADNLASRAVAAKAGFAIEGILRDYAERGGKRHDTVLHSRLSTDPPPNFDPLAPLDRSQPTAGDGGPSTPQSRWPAKAKRTR